MFKNNTCLISLILWISALRETLKADQFVFFVPFSSSFVTQAIPQFQFCHVVPHSFSLSISHFSWSLYNLPFCFSLSPCFPLSLRIRHSALFAQPLTLGITFALYQERVIRIAYQVDSHLSLWLICFFHLFMELSRIKDECHLLRWHGTHGDDRSFIFICGRGRLLARRPPDLVWRAVWYEYSQPRVAEDEPGMNSFWNLCFSPNCTLLPSN